jgi:hypothetical protein
LSRAGARRLERSRQEAMLVSGPSSKIGTLSGLFRRTKVIEGV